MIAKQRILTSSVQSFGYYSLNIHSTGCFIREFLKHKLTIKSNSQGCIIVQPESGKEAPKESMSRRFLQEQK